LWIGYGFLPNNVTNTYTVNSISGQIVNKTVYTSNDDLQSWYIAVTSSQTTPAAAITLTVTAHACADADTFGLYCNRTVNTTSGSVYPVVLDVSSNVNENSTKYTLNKAGDIDYYQVNTVDFPGFYLRVSVGAVDAKVASPTLLARADAIPTLSSFDYNITTGETANQVILSSTPTTWYLAVYGTKNQNYGLWVGSNCANNCTAHGTCVCNGAACTDDNLYELPTTVDDSFGVCPCEKDYTVFDCSVEDGDDFKTIYIVLIAVGGAIVLAVAIGVPVYCYVQNRKRSKYERV
jgi:hypothetical protein